MLPVAGPSPQTCRMAIGVTRGVDLLPATGAALAAGMGFAYVAVVRGQGSQPLRWALACGGAVLAGLGLLAIFSIGLPLLLAASLIIGGLARSLARTP